MEQTISQLLVRGAQASCSRTELISVQIITWRDLYSTGPDKTASSASFCKPNRLRRVENAGTSYDTVGSYDITSGSSYKFNTNNFSM